MRPIDPHGDELPIVLERYGPTARLDIANDPQGVGQSFQFHQREYTALIDTGARMSSIDVGIAERLNLPIIGPPIDGIAASGPFRSDPVLALIHLPDFETTVYGRFLTLPLVEHDLPVQVLIGRDILRRRKLSYDGIVGIWAMEFDLPTFTIGATQSSTNPSS